MEIVNENGIVAELPRRPQGGSGVQRPDPSLTVNVSVTDTDIFKGLLHLIRDVYHMADDGTKEYIKESLNGLIGKTHDIDAAMKSW